MHYKSVLFIYFWDIKQKTHFYLLVYGHLYCLAPKRHHKSDFSQYDFRNHMIALCEEI